MTVLTYDAGIIPQCYR